MIARLQRDTVITVLALAVLLFLWRPRAPALALGVIGGGVLAALSYWAIRGAVASMTSGVPGGGPNGAGVITAEEGETREFRPVSRLFALVKFFTRHAILALVAYGMMARLRLDPIGMLIGVSAPVVAAALESLRYLRKS